LLNPLLPQGSDMDTTGTGVPRNHAILRFHQGKVKNRGNLKRAARRCNIPNPLSLLIQDIFTHLEVCKKQCAFYQEHGQHFHRKHLNTRLRLAKEQEDEEVFQKISAIIQREHQRSFWRKLNYVTGKKNKKPNLDSGRRSGRVSYETHNSGVCRESYFF
jgi:hypothetical protein